MLEIKNLTKIYRSKSGNSVTALDNVSITFPDTGMVFVLGKSGSGKSTLLNVIGGLDDCDSGEFIIKGKSSKSFVGSDFDAYRNTFIGFIFQEYNVLDDFTVGANIGLALELQGKKATSEKITQILNDVDMLDYAKRKPNELSGGQKQRVAIARALVKDPEIIMADEPTGALDSNTGKQIFDTLKELSKTKLVIIVSHDRDFAEKYGDRVIEMMDGKIISDITKHEVEPEIVSSGIIKMGDNLLRIEEGYQLTARDVEVINAYLRAQKGEILVSGDTRINNSVRSTAGITENNTTSVFDDTDESKDVKLKEYDAKKTKFIRSRLPMKNALKIGSSGLGHKKFRLVSTIALCLVAFTLFGFADTLGSYDKEKAAVESIIDSNIQNASFSLRLKHTYEYKDRISESYYETAMNEDDIKYLCEKTGIDFVPVFTGSDSVEWGNRMSLTNNMISTDHLSNDCAYTGALYGLTAVDQNKIAQLGFTMTGRMPVNEDEIAITEFLYRELNLTGFKNREYDEEIKAGELTLEEGGANSIIGKHITVNINGMDTTLTITGVIDTRFDYDRYNKYVPTANSSNTEQQSTEANIVDMVMQKELSNTLTYGFHALGYVNQTRIDELAEYMSRYSSGNSLGISMNWSSYIVIPSNADSSEDTRYISRIAKSSDMGSVGKITWFDGRGANTLAENEILISSEVLNNGSFMGFEVGKKVRGFLEARYPGLDVYSYQGSVYSFVLAAEQNNYAATRTVCAEIIKGVYGIEVSDNLENNYYESILCDYVNVEDRYIYADSLVWMLARTQAYEMCRVNPNVFKTEEFYNSVMSERYNTYDLWISNYNVNEAVEAYVSTINPDPKSQKYGDKSYEDYYEEARKLIVGLIISDGNPFAEMYIKVTTWEKGTEMEKTYRDYKVVGMFEGGSMDLMICDGFYALYEAYAEEQGYPKETIAPHAPGVYSFVIAPMPMDRAMIEKLVALTYTDGEDLKFVLQNQVMDTLYSFNEFIEIGAKVFLYVGLGFALFAALMMMNFISTSISYKRREIGILRAVGARSSDVFKIFFSEAAIIALITYVLSVGTTITATVVVNTVLRNEGINVTLVNFGIRQVVLILLINIAVAALASFLPVWKIAKRNPIDAIKNK
jgi:ABC-type lipoprotein export system ATPase subunit